MSEEKGTVLSQLGFNQALHMKPLVLGTSFTLADFPEITQHYLMRGLNAGSAYVYWEVTREPDLLAVKAPEAIPDLGTVTIAAEWV